jgi:hypothetical protein
MNHIVSLVISAQQPVTKTLPALVEARSGHDGCAADAICIRRVQ